MRRLNPHKIGNPLTHVRKKSGSSTIPSAEEIVHRDERGSLSLGGRVQYGHHGIGQRIFAVAYEPNTRLIAVATARGLVKVFGGPGVEVILERGVSAASSEPQSSIQSHDPHESCPFYMAFAGGGTYLVGITRSGTVYVWSTIKGKRVAYIPSMMWIDWSAVASAAGSHGGGGGGGGGGSSGSYRSNSRRGAVDFTVTSAHLQPGGGTYLYVGTSTGNVHVVKVLPPEYANIKAYKISRSEMIAIAGDTPVESYGGVVALASRPLGSGRRRASGGAGEILIGFACEAIALWDWTKKKCSAMFIPPFSSGDDDVEGSGGHVQGEAQLICLSWHSNGEMFAAGYANGAIVVFNTTGAEAITGNKKRRGEVGTGTSDLYWIPAPQSIEVGGLCVVRTPVISIDWVTIWQEKPVVALEHDDDAPPSLSSLDTATVVPRTGDGKLPYDGLVVAGGVLMDETAGCDGLTLLRVLPSAERNVHQQQHRPKLSIEADDKQDKEADVDAAAIAAPVTAGAAPPEVPAAPVVRRAILPPAPLPVEPLEKGGGGLFGKRRASDDDKRKLANSQARRASEASAKADADAAAAAAGGLVSKLGLGRRSSADSPSRSVSRSPPPSRGASRSPSPVPLHSSQRAASPSPPPPSPPPPPPPAIDDEAEGGTKGDDAADGGDGGGVGDESTSLLAHCGFMGVAYGMERLLGMTVVPPPPPPHGMADDGMVSSSGDIGAAAAGGADASGGPVTLLVLVSSPKEGISSEGLKVSEPSSHVVVCEVEPSSSPGVSGLDEGGENQASPARPLPLPHHLSAFADVTAIKACPSTMGIAIHKKVSQALISFETGYQSSAKKMVEEKTRWILQGGSLVWDQSVPVDRQDALAYSELVVMGHADGVISFWEGSIPKGQHCKNHNHHHQRQFEAGGNGAHDDDYGGGDDHGGGDGSNSSCEDTQTGLMMLGSLPVGEWLAKSKRGGSGGRCPVTCIEVLMEGGESNEYLDDEDSISVPHTCWIVIGLKDGQVLVLKFDDTDVANKPWDAELGEAPAIWRGSAIGGGGGNQHTNSDSGGSGGVSSSGSGSIGGSGPLAGSGGGGGGGGGSAWRRGRRGKGDEDELEAAIANARAEVDRIAYEKDGTLPSYRRPAKSAVQLILRRAHTGPISSLKLCAPSPPLTLSSSSSSPPPWSSAPSPTRLCIADECGGVSVVNIQTRDVYVLEERREEPHPPASKGRGKSRSRSRSRSPARAAAATAAPSSSSSSYSPFSFRPLLVTGPMPPGVATREEGRVFGTEALYIIKQQQQELLRVFDLYSISFVTETIHFAPPATSFGGSGSSGGAGGSSGGGGALENAAENPPLLPRHALWAFCVDEEGRDMRLRKKRRRKRTKDGSDYDNEHAGGNGSDGGSGGGGGGGSGHLQRHSASALALTSPSVSSSLASSPIASPQSYRRMSSVGQPRLLVTYRDGVVCLFRVEAKWVEVPVLKGGGEKGIAGGIVDAFTHTMFTDDKAAAKRKAAAASKAPPATWVLKLECVTEALAAVSSSPASALLSSLPSSMPPLQSYSSTPPPPPPPAAGAVSVRNHRNSPNSSPQRHTHTSPTTTTTTSPTMTTTTAAVTTPISLAIRQQPYLASGAGLFTALFRPAGPSEIVVIQDNEVVVQLAPMIEKSVLVIVDSTGCISTFLLPSLTKCYWATVGQGVDTVLRWRRPPHQRSRSSFAVEDDDNGEEDVDGDLEDSPNITPGQVRVSGEINMGTHVMQRRNVVPPQCFGCSGDGEMIWVAGPKEVVRWSMQVQREVDSQGQPIPQQHQQLGHKVYMHKVARLLTSTANNTLTDGAGSGGSMSAVGGPPPPSSSLSPPPPPSLARGRSGSGSGGSSSGGGGGGTGGVPRKRSFALGLMSRNIFRRRTSMEDELDLLFVGSGDYVETTKVAGGGAGGAKAAPGVGGGTAVVTDNGVLPKRGSWTAGGAAGGSGSGSGSGAAATGGSRRGSAPPEKSELFNGRKDSNDASSSKRTVRGAHGQVAATKSVLGEAHMQLADNVEKLNRMEDKTAKLNDEASNFADLAAQLEADTKKQADCVVS